MKIIYQKLVGYKRLALANIRSFEYTPEELIQLILGTNGSGKSSVVKELTPLPADPADYSKDGSKTIKIKHRGNLYTMSTVFSPKTTHSFLKDGEEQNPGGTATVQRELVKNAFGVTPEIHDLLTGVEKFHLMSPSRRREWFTILSDISYDYALSVYAKLKERSRDVSGALKLAKKRLVTETAKVISDAEEKKLQSDLNALHSELNLLIEQSAPLDNPVAFYEQNETEMLAELSRLSNKLLRMRFVAPYGVHPTHGYERNEWYELVRPGFSSIEEIDTLLGEIKSQITVKETVISGLAADHKKYSDTLAILKRTGEAGANALKEKLEVLRAERSGILAKRKLGLEFTDAGNAQSALESAYELLVYTFSHIPENADKRFNNARLQELEQLTFTAKDSRTGLLNQIAALASRKSHMDAHKTNGAISCPKCKHGWILGYSATDHESLINDIDTKEAEVRVLDERLAGIEKEITEIREYSDLYRDFSRCTKNWPILNPFWTYLIEEEIVTRSPKRAMSVMETLRLDLGLAVKADAVESEISETKEILIAAESTGNATLSETTIKMDECDHLIGNLTSEVANLQSSHAAYSHYKRQLTEAIELGNTISALRKSAEKNNADMIEMVRRETLNHCVRQLQHQLALKQTTLTQAQLQKGIIADIAKQIHALEIDDEAARLLVSELSPTDGLIAEGLLGFIRNYTGQMNGIIRKIWSYPMHILDCGKSGDAGADLDYKFPVMVKTKENVVPDVKLGSAGMQEMFDLSFKIVAMRYLGLSESPLFLDEFGKGFDEDHRVNASAAVKSLMDTQAFTQLFMISHYDATYGSFTNAEVCVLDATNISVPSVHNRHVVIHH